MLLAFKERNRVSRQWPDPLPKVVFARRYEVSHV